MTPKLPNSAEILQTVSTLSILEPFRRAALRIPFLYQRISSTSPVTALIATKATNTSMTTVNLDGTTDWMIVGSALLAWTGQTLSVKPSMNRSMVCNEHQLGKREADRLRASHTGVIPMSLEGDCSRLQVKGLFPRSFLRQENHMWFIRGALLQTYRAINSKVSSAISLRTPLTLIRLRLTDSSSLHSASRCRR